HRGTPESDRLQTPPACCDHAGRSSWSTLLFETRRCGLVIENRVPDHSRCHRIRPPVAVEKLGLNNTAAPMERNACRCLRTDTGSTAREPAGIGTVPEPN